MKPSWLVKWRGSALRIHFDLHDEIYQPVMKAVLGMHNPQTELQELESPKPEPALAWLDAHTAAKQLMAGQAQQKGFRVLSEAALQYEPQYGVFGRADNCHVIRDGCLHLAEKNAKQGIGPMPGKISCLMKYLDRMKRVGLQTLFEALKFSGRET